MVEVPLKMSVAPTEIAVTTDSVLVEQEPSRETRRRLRERKTGPDGLDSKDAEGGAAGPARQWKGRGVDGGVSPRTGASRRIVLAHCAGTRRGCVPSGEFVGTSPSLFPRDGKRARHARS